MRLRRERDLLSDAGAVVGRTSRAALAVVAAAVLWGTTGTAQALLGPSDDPLRPIAVGLARLALGGAALAVLTLLPAARRRERAPSGPILLTVVVGVSAVVAYHVLFFTGVARLGVALGTVVTLGLAPLAAGAGAALVERRRPARSWAVATAIAVAGLVVLLVPTAGIALDAVGLAIAAGAGLAYAAYALVSKRLLDRGVGPGRAMALVFGGGGIVALAGLALPGPGAALLEVASRPQGVAIVAWLGLASVALSYRFYARGLADLATERATTLTLAEPLTAATLGVLVLGERPGVRVALGAALVLGGLVAGSVSGGARPRSATPRPARPV